MNFKIVKEIDIEELKCTLMEVIHEPSGAKIMHIANDDDENVFNLSFRTLPESSNGVAHILEHTVLCGSEHFPVRDPFFSMTRRSLNTFMNALTGSDFTCYPAASQVPKDFYNLLDVYLDAVFHPKLLETSFLQEGHRLEFAEMKNPKSELQYKGIVFNEMKGALATGDARLGELLMQTLFPDITYGVNSGGDPREILNLTYEQLKAFHAKYYHPSRCLYFFYGNIPLESHLNFLEQKILKDAQPCDPIPPIPKQPRFAKPRVVVSSYPISEDPKEKTLIGIGWLTCSILEQVELLAINVIDMVLMGTDAGLLKRVLLASELCKQVDSTLDNEMSEIPYFLVFRGCRSDAEQPIEALVYKTLKEIAANGLPENLVDGAIHQLEMARTEITGSSAPYGLSLYFRAALLHQHGGNAEDGLCVHSLFNTLRKKVADPTYLTGLIQKHLIDNPHFIRIVMHPDLKLSEKELNEEKRVLKALQKKMSVQQAAEIVRQSQQLAEMQEDDSTDLLPKVTLKDVNKHGKEFHLKQEHVGPYKLYHHPCFTNAHVYTDIVFDLPAIAEEDLAYLRLFSVILPQMGCGGRSYAQNLDYILEHVGGAGLSLELYPQADDPKHLKPALSVRGKALARKMDKLFPLLRDMIVSTNFRDPTRIKEVLMQHYYGIENSIQTSSLRYAINLAASGLSVPSKIGNCWYGLEYYWKLGEIVKNFDKDQKPLIEKLEAMQSQCLGLKGAELVLTSDENTLEQLKKEHFYGLYDIPQKAFSAWKGDYPIAPVESQGRITASPVAFTALLFPTVCYTDPAAAALSVASEIMENKTLHKKIREQGGAYGSGASASLLSGQFYFYAYRDPHLVSTHAAFGEAAKNIAQGKFDAQEIEEAKLGLFQELDSPIAPGTRGLTTYSRLRGGRTSEVRQAFRENLFKVEKEQLVEAAKKILVPGVKNGTLVCFASKEFLEKENSLFKGAPLPLYSL